MDARAVIGDYEVFFEELLQEVRALDIKIEGMPIDHICYRVETLDRYESMKESLMPLAKAWGENIHHGRPISAFLLKNPLKAEGYSVPVIELPAPKSDKFYPEGLEHFEFVVGSRFFNFREEYKDLWNRFEDSGPHNQPAVISFSSGKSVKFHEKTLLKVLELENHPLAPVDS